MYEDGRRVLDIAKKYGVTERTLYNHFKRWGIEVIRGAYKKRDKKRKHFKRRFSPGLKVMMAINTAINNEHMKKVKFKNRTEEQRLVSNIIQHTIIG